MLLKVSSAILSSPLLVHDRYIAPEDWILKNLRLFMLCNKQADKDYIFMSNLVSSTGDLLFAVSSALEDEVNWIWPFVVNVIHDGHNLQAQSCILTVPGHLRSTTAKDKARIETMIHDKSEQ